MDCIVHGVAKNRTRLSDFHFTFTFRMFCLDFRVGIPAPVRIQCHCWSRRRRNSAALQMIGLAVSTCESQQCLFVIIIALGFPVGSLVENLPANAEDAGSVPRLRRSPGEGNSNPVQKFLPENSMDSGAWWTTAHEVAESDTI